MKQLLALLVSACLILGAWVLTRSGDGATDEETTLAVVCATEAEDFCSGLSIRHSVETPGETLARLTEAESAELDNTLWVVSEPWPELLALSREGAGLGTERTSDGLASASTDVAGRAQAMGQLLDTCQPTPSWKCLLSEQDASWDSIGVPATATTEGLLTVVGLANGVLGPGDYATNDLDQPELTAAFEAVRSADGNQRTEVDPFTTMATRAGTYDLAFGLDLDEAVATLAQSASFRAATPTQGVLARLVIDRADSLDADDAARVLGDGKDLDALLDASGWDTGAADAPTTVPSAGVVAALLEKWDSLL